MESQEFIKKAKYLEQQKREYGKEYMEQQTKTIYAKGGLEHVNRFLFPYAYEIENNPKIFDKSIDMFWITHYFSLKRSNSKSPKEVMIETLMARHRKLSSKKEALQNEVNELKRQLL